MSLISFVINYKYILLFYVLILLILYANRRRFEFQAKVIALYRTKIGISFMNRIAKKYNRAIILFGKIAVPLGYIGMAFISFTIIKGLFDLFFKPGAPPVVAPVLPGLPIMGMGMVFPFFKGIIALFIVVVIHEFFHGIMAGAYGIKIKNTGFAMFGPIPAAFVDPEEKEIKKKDSITQLSIFSAGPISNIFTAAIIILVLKLMFFGFTPLVQSTESGINIQEIDEGSPASIAGVKEGVYNIVNGVRFNTTEQFVGLLENIKPGENILLGNENGGYTINAIPNPEDKSKAYLGVHFVTEYNLGNSIFIKAAIQIFSIIQWIFILSIGLGLANLLPLGPVDGGRMFKVAMNKYFGEKKGNQVWMKVSYLFFLIILILLLVPIFKSLFGIA